MTTVPYDVVQDVIAVLNHISTGVVPTRACDECGVAYSTFVSYTTRYPQLAQMRVEAEDRCYDCLADKLLVVHEEISDPKMATVISSNTKWLLERRRSKAYGAKSTLEVNISADREVLDALQMAKARAQGTGQIADRPADVLDLSIVNGVASVMPAVLPFVPDAAASGSDAEFDELEHRRQFAEIS